MRVRPGLDGCPAAQHLATRQHIALLVIQPGLGFHQLLARLDAIALTCNEAVITQANLAGHAQRLALHANRPAATYLELEACFQLMLAGCHLKVAAIRPALVIQAVGHQQGIGAGIQLDPGLLRVGLGQG